MAGMKKLLVAAIALLPTGAWAACVNPTPALDKNSATVNLEVQTGPGGNCVPETVLVQGGALVATGNGLFVQPGGSTTWTATGSGSAGTPASGVLTVQGITSMTALKVDGTGGTFPISGSLTANQSVNVTQLGGNAIKVGSGAGSSTGSANVYIATDQPSLTNAQPGNFTQIGGASVSTAASGVQKVGIVGNAAGALDAATGAAPPANALQIGAVASGATGGLLQNIKTCDSHAKYDASTNGSTSIISGVSGRKIYICGFIIQTGGTATNVKLVEGTHTTTDCDTSSANVTPAYQLLANSNVGVNAAFWTGLATATAANGLCVNASAGNAVQADVFYTIQ
jgi:hypothetical protein